MKLDFHSKYFCRHSAWLFFFIQSAETFLSVSWLIWSSCQQSGCSLLWISRRDVVARNDNHHSDPAPLCQPSSCFLCRPLCNNTPPLSHIHFIFNCISLTISICKVEAVLPNGVPIHTQLMSHPAVNASTSVSQADRSRCLVIGRSQDPPSTSPVHASVSYSLPLSWVNTVSQSTSK